MFKNSRHITPDIRTGGAFGRDDENDIQVVKDRRQLSSQPKIMVLPVKIIGNKNKNIAYEQDKVTELSFQENKMWITAFKKYLLRKERTVGEHIRLVCEEA